ncbi:OmpA family protein [Ignavibacteria bacterium]|nr:PD40 domain-containing protein [Bacteroidota bacterium]MCZ2131854.1 OmpA family protein [Bacteroidota bacterium]
MKTQLMRLTVLFVFVFSLAAAVSTAVAQQKPIQVTRPDFNTNVDEFGTSLVRSGRFLYYTSEREGDGQRLFYVERSSSGWREPEMVSGDVNDGEQVGAPTLTPDGQFMVFSAYRHDAENIGRTDLFSARKIDGAWTEVKNLGADVNSDYFDSQPSISSDGMTLYFSSDRPGGMGGTDIWMTARNGDSWTNPVNVRSVNSSNDEMSPSIAADGKTFYFASNRGGGAGGFDLYVCKKSGDAFGTARNMGTPINTVDDEYFYTSLQNTDIGFFSRGTDAANFDVMMIVPNPFPSEPALIVTGTVADAVTNQPLGATITLTDLKTGKKVADMRSDDVTGEYLVTLNAGHVYSVTASKNGYVFYSQRFETPPNEQGTDLTKNINLSPIRGGNTRLLVFFDYNKTDLKEESIPELERAIEFLKDNPELKISMEGHTDDQGGDEYNDKLSLRRAEAVKKYLSDGGIDASRISTKGNGKRMPLVKGSNDEARAQNRRVEMIVLQ